MSDVHSTPDDHHGEHEYVVEIEKLPEWLLAGPWLIARYEWLIREPAKGGKRGSIMFAPSGLPPSGYAPTERAAVRYARRRARKIKAFWERDEKEVTIHV